MFINLIRKMKSNKGNSLAEFAVTTAMMATLATTAAPKFGAVGAGAKEKKTMANIDKILTVANNYYNQTLSEEGKGRFPGQEKYNVAVGGYEDEPTLLSIIGNEAGDNAFNSYDHAEGGNWRSIFGVSANGALLSDESNVINDVGTAGHEEFMAEFANNAIKSPFQDGHYIYIVLPGGVDYVDPDGDGTYVKVQCNECSPILYVADNENPSKLFKKYQP